MSSDVVAHSSTEDRHTVDDEAYEPTYAEAFPPLPVANASDRGEPTSQAPAPQWKKLSLKTSTVTQVRGPDVYLLTAHHLYGRHVIRL